MSKVLVRRLICSVLVLLMAFEPAVLPVLRASEYDAAVQSIQIDPEEVGSVNLEEIMTPAELLDGFFNLKGKTAEDAEVRSWAEWGNTLAASYMALDEGAGDVFTFYDGLVIFKDAVSVPKDIAGTLTDIVKNTVLATAFLKTKLLSDTGTRAANTRNAFNGLVRFNSFAENASNWISQNKVFNFLEFCSAPSCPVDTKNAAKGFDAYWRWVKKAPVEGEGAVNLNNAQGVARTIGIGLSVLGLALSLYSYFSAEDFAGGRLGAYNMVKKSISVALGVCGILAMFIPGLGQAIAIAALVIGIVTMIGDAIGKLNKCWKQAYFTSAWYLYENDPEYVTFYDERDSLLDEEMSDTLALIHKNYAEYAGADENSEDEVEARNARVFKALEKQGVLTSYYACKDYELDSYDLDYLQKLWNAKRAYMAYKPTEEEAKKAETASGWDKFCNSINPMTHIKFVANKIGSRDYNKLSKNENLKPVYFNPDYILIKRFRSYTTNRDLTGPLHRTVALRIEQSPFNYIPLVGIDPAEWSDELLSSAYLADAFMVGQKEIDALSIVIKELSSQVDDKIDTAEDKVELIEKDLKSSVKVKKALRELLENYKNDPDKVSKRLYSKITKTLKTDKDFNNKKTPKNIINEYKNEIEQVLFYEPLSLGYKAFEMVAAMDAAKQILDSGAIVKSYYENRKATFDEFDEKFKDGPIKDYVKDGNFLNNIKDSAGEYILDWLSEDYSTYDNMKKGLNLFKNSVKKYENTVDDLDTDDFIETLNDLNAQLTDWQSLIEEYSEYADDLEMNVLLAEDTEFANKIFFEYKLPYELKALDPSKEIAEYVAEAASNY